MSADADKAQQNTNDGSWIVELIVAAVVLYFARRAAPMLAYHDKIGVGERLWERADGILEHAMALIMMWNSPALSFITIAIPLLIFFARDSKQDISGIGIGFIALGPLGWYIGKEFAKAFARKAACQSQSFFGFGCTLNGEPFLTYLLFSLIVVSVAVSVAFVLLGVIFEKIGRMQEAGKGGS